MNIGFLGGTGIEAKGLALRFAAAGAAVILGSRSQERAAAAADACNSILGNPHICGRSNQEMLAPSEMIFLTVPFGQALDAVESCASFFTSNHILIDVTVPMVFYKGHIEYLEQEGLSNAEVIAGHMPHGVPLVAAFKTIPAAVLMDLEMALNCDVLICSDVEEATRKVMDLASTIPSLRPINGGPLKTARTLERMTVLAVELNRRYKRKGARFRIEGI
jgi:NADPH-dependent F420 reductase